MIYVSGAAGISWFWFDKMDQLLGRRPTAEAIDDGMEMDPPVDGEWSQIAVTGVK